MQNSIGMIFKYCFLLIFKTVHCYYRIKEIIGDVNREEIKCTGNITTQR